MIKALICNDLIFDFLFKDNFFLNNKLKYFFRKLINSLSEYLYL